jgi:signal transduction histidine kinase
LDPRLERAPVDPARLKQVLLNLLLNAREALSGPGTIRVATRRESTDYAISVSDTGKGIPDEDLPNIFDPFFTQKPNGTGLGLSVARNIVEGLGGTISVRSQLGRGTEIELRLPMEPRLADARTAKGAET